jgi:cold-inducible RNA-binding protein
MTPKGKGTIMNNILIRNLDPGATEEEIRSIFEQHGTVERFKMMTDFKTDQPRGFAFVQMTNDSDAETAIAATDGMDLSGRPMRVSAARPQIHRGPQKRSK